MIKINLGCGFTGKDGWINFDWGVLAFLHRFRLVESILLKLNLFPKGYDVKWPHNLRLHNCKKRLRFKADSVDYIYTSHFLEHVKKYEALEILKDCHRVLKKQGTIRISVPDLELLANKYVEKDEAYFRKLNSLTHDTPEGALSSSILLADVLISSFFPEAYRVKPRGINRIAARFGRPHLWMYDYQSLHNLLVAAGFNSIEKRRFREGQVPDLDYLDVMPETSLYVEGVK